MALWNDHGKKTCRTCACFRGGICRATSDVNVNPRSGLCDGWEARVEVVGPKCPEHEALIEAIALLLRAYPELWYNQAHVIAKVLQATKRDKPDWGKLADEIWSLRKWVMKEGKRKFRKACVRAGAKTER